HLQSAVGTRGRNSERGIDRPGNLVSASRKIDLDPITRLCQAQSDPNRFICGATVFENTIPIKILLENSLAVRQLGEFHPHKPLRIGENVIHERNQRAGTITLSQQLETRTGAAVRGDLGVEVAQTLIGRADIGSNDRVDILQRLTSRVKAHWRESQPFSKDAR